MDVNTLVSLNDSRMYLPFQQTLHLLAKIYELEKEDLGFQYWQYTIGSLNVSHPFRCWTFLLLQWQQDSFFSGDTFGFITPNSPDHIPVRYKVLNECTADDVQHRPHNDFERYLSKKNYSIFRMETTLNV